MVYASFCFCSRSWKVRDDRSSCMGFSLLIAMIDACPLDRGAIHEATMLHVNALALNSPAPSFPHSPATDDVLMRSRLFWYAHLQEGIYTAIRGGRLVLYVISSGWRHDINPVGLIKDTTMISSTFKALCLPSASLHHRLRRISAAPRTISSSPIYFLSPFASVLFAAEHMLW